MNKLMAHLRSTNVIQALGIAAALLVYSLTKDVALAATAAVAVMGTVPSSTMAMIAKLESLEDMVANIAVPPGVVVTHTVENADGRTTVVTGSPAAVAVAMPTVAAIGKVVGALGFLFIVCGAFSACTSADVAKVTVSLATAQTDAQNAVALYGISKGIADTAVLVNPTLAPAVAKLEAIADPIAAKLQLTVTDATADATAIEALVTQIQTQANTLTVQTAGNVRVLPATN